MKQDKSVVVGKNQKNFFRILIFTALSVVSILLVFVFTTDKQTNAAFTFNALFNMKPLFLILTFVAWFCALSSDSINMMFLVHGTGEKLRIRDSYRLSLLRIFFNCITPFSAGGQPFTVFALTKLDVSSGKGSSVVIMRLILINICTFLGAIYAFFFFGNKIMDIPVLRWPFLITMILVIVLSAMGVLALLFPGLLLFLVKVLARILFKLHIVKNLASFKLAIIRQVVNARSSFKNFFTKHKGFLLGGFVSSIFMYVSQITTLFFIMKALGISITFATGFAGCALLIFLFSFMPTPGASGLGDILFVIIFTGTGLIPKYLIGIVVLLWRTFYQYLSAIFGAIFSARFFSNRSIKTTIPDKS